MMPDDPKEWEKEVKHWCVMNGIHVATVVAFPPERFVDLISDVTIKSVNAFLPCLPFKIRNAYGSFVFSGNTRATITSLENCPDYVADEFVCGELTGLKTFKHFPKTVGGVYLPSTTLPPNEYRFLLLSIIRGDLNFYGGPLEIDQVTLLTDVLMNGRSSDGSMPSEFIPGKIRQLKEMDGKW